MKAAKKIFIFIYIALIIPFLIGCDFSDYLTQKVSTTTTSAISTTMPSTQNGTITFTDSDYEAFGIYSSSTYDLTDIDQYNQILLNTKSLIRHANIQVVSTLYDERVQFPWSTLTEKYIIGTNYGSGVVFMEDDTYYYAVTNNHVIDPEEYEATYQKKTYGETDRSNAEVIAADSNLDLAVVRFEKASHTDVSIVNIYNRLYYKFNPGELVLAVGNPQNVINNVTFGEFKSMESIDNVDFKVIYHDAQIHEGSSGGALVDVDGNLLGINTWGIDDNDEYSFSIPNYIVYQFLINEGILA